MLAKISISLFVCFVLVLNWYVVKADEYLSDAHDYIRAWAYCDNAPPLRGVHGKIISTIVNKILKDKYNALPQIGELLIAVSSNRCYIVTARHVPQQPDPTGYIELQELNPKDTTVATRRVPVMSYFSNAYEKLNAM